LNPRYALAALVVFSGITLGCSKTDAPSGSAAAKAPAPPTARVESPHYALELKPGGPCKVGADCVATVELDARGGFVGPGFVDWLDKADSFHRVLMREAKFKAPAAPLAPSSNWPAAPTTKAVCVPCTRGLSRRAGRNGVSASMHTSVCVAVGSAGRPSQVVVARTTNRLPSQSERG